MLASLTRSWTAKDIPSLKGKVAVVTGANSGIGYVTALELGRAGAKVFCLCRSPERGGAAVAAMSKAVPKASFSFVLCDMNSLASVKAAADQVLQKTSQIDILVNNAGVMMMPKRQETKDGFEEQMGVNHLAHFALTARLLPALRKAKARVVNVASMAAWSGNLKTEWGLDFRVPKERYQPQLCYGNSKLANLIFTRQLAKRFPDLTVVAAHPGGTNTDLHKFAVFGGRAFRAVMQQPETGALPSLRAAVDPTFTSGSYCVPWGGMWGVPSNRSGVMHWQARDEDLGTRFWAASAAATGLTSNL